MNEIYLDNAATTKAYPEVIDTIVKVMSNEYYNPSAFYKPSLLIEKRLNKVREIFAEELNCLPEEIFFTSGATESNNTIIKSVVNSLHGNFNIIASSIEHPSVMEVLKEFEAKGIDVRYIPVDKFGNLDLDWFRQNLDENTKFVTIMGVNNEIGTVLDLVSIRNIIEQSSANPFFHVDLVQGFLKTDDNRIDLTKVKPDAISLSAHKFHGPKGVGIMMLKNTKKFQPLLNGGGQEKGIRSGTENVSSIIAMGEAAKIKSKKKKKDLTVIENLQKYLVNELKDIDYIEINTPEDSITGIINVSIKGVKAEVLLHMLEMKNIFISAGSACSTHHKKNHVHSALGFDKDKSLSTIRISLGENTKEEIDYFIQELKRCIKEIRKVTKFKP